LTSGLDGARHGCTMGQQSNKVEKRKRREQREKRKKLAAKTVSKKSSK